VTHEQSPLGSAFGRASNILSKIAKGIVYQIADQWIAFDDRNLPHGIPQ